jgi:nicotinamidase-related amidase
VTLPNSSVLVVVDAQVGFVSPHSAHVLPVIANLLKWWQDAGRASILTQFVNAPDSPYVRLIGWSALMPGDPGVELDPQIAPYASTATAVIRKGGYTALTDAVFDLVSRHGWQNLYVAGMDTESCVLATVLGAFEAGLTPWLVTDACASHAGPVEHEAGLLVARRYVGASQLITTADVLPTADQASSEAP